MSSGRNPGFRNLVLLTVAGVLLVIAAAVYFMSGRTPAPSAETQAATERNRQIQSNMEQPPQPDLPVNQRAPRGAVAPGK